MIYLWNCYIFCCLLWLYDFCVFNRIDNSIMIKIFLFLIKIFFDSWDAKDLTQMDVLSALGHTRHMVILKSIVFNYHHKGKVFVKCVYKSVCYIVQFFLERASNLSRSLWELSPLVKFYSGQASMFHCQNPIFIWLLDLHLMSWP